MASALSNSATHATTHDILERKRDREKINQRNKRQREREYTLGLEAKIRQLESRLQLHDNVDRAEHLPPCTGTVDEVVNEDDCLVGLENSTDTVPGAHGDGSVDDVGSLPAHGVTEIPNIDTINAEHLPPWPYILGDVMHFGQQTSSDPATRTALCNVDQMYATPSTSRDVHVPSMIVPGSISSTTSGSRSRAKSASGRHFGLLASPDLFNQLFTAPEWLRLPFRLPVAHN